MNDDSVRGEEVAGRKMTTAQESQSLGISSDAHAVHPKMPTDTARDLTLRVPDGKDDSDSSTNSKFREQLVVKIASLLSQSGVRAIQLQRLRSSLY